MVAAGLPSCMPCRALAVAWGQRAKRSNANAANTPKSHETPFRDTDLVGSATAEIDEGLPRVGTRLLERCDSQRLDALWDAATLSEAGAMVSRGISVQSFATLMLEGGGLEYSPPAQDVANQHISLDVFGVPSFTPPVLPAEGDRALVWSRRATTHLENSPSCLTPLQACEPPAHKPFGCMASDADGMKIVDELFGVGSPTLLTCRRPRTMSQASDGAKSVTTLRNDTLLLDAGMEISDGINDRELQWLKDVASPLGANWDLNRQCNAEMHDELGAFPTVLGRRHARGSTSSTEVEKSVTASLTEKTLDIAVLSSRIAGRWAYATALETGGIISDNAKVASESAVQSFVEVTRHVDSAMNFYVERLRERVQQDDASDDDSSSYASSPRFAPTELPPIEECPQHHFSAQLLRPQVSPRPLLELASNTHGAAVQRATTVIANTPLSYHPVAPTLQRAATFKEASWSHQDAATLQRATTFNAHPVAASQLASPGNIQRVTSGSVQNSSAHLPAHQAVPRGPALSSPSIYGAVPKHAATSSLGSADWQQTVRPLALGRVSSFGC